MASAFFPTPPYPESPFRMGRGERLYTSKRRVQPLNAWTPIFSRDVGRTRVERFIQPSKADAPISVSPSGNVNAVMDSQYLNASLPMVLTLDGRLMLFNELQTENIRSGIDVMPFGNVTDTRFSQDKRQPPRLVIESGNSTDTSPLQ